jgi:Flp pilus assembly protein TadD
VMMLCVRRVHRTLGNFLARRGLLSDAEVEYKAALRLSPRYTLAAINLADLFRRPDRAPDRPG